MVVSAVTPSKWLDFHDNSGAMATIRPHVTKLYTLVTSLYVEYAYQVCHLEVRKTLRLHLDGQKRLLC